MLSCDSNALDSSIDHRSVPSKIGVEIVSHLHKSESCHIRVSGTVLSSPDKVGGVHLGKHPQYVPSCRCGLSDFPRDYRGKPKFRCFLDRSLDNPETDMGYGERKYSIFHVYIPNLGEG